MRHEESVANGRLAREAAGDLTASSSTCATAIASAAASAGGGWSGGSAGCGAGSGAGSEGKTLVCVSALADGGGGLRSSACAIEAVRHEPQRETGA